MEIHKENSTEETKNNAPPRKTAILEMLLKVDPNHHLVQKYNQQAAEYEKNLNDQIKVLEQKKDSKIILPELKPIDVESLYSRFLEAFEFFNGKKFDEKVNEGEGRILARTICLYLTGKKAFLKSPLINSQISKPDLSKGILIIGGKGIGKTSIMRTFNEMFFYARSHGLTVTDIEGTHQQLRRYRLGFGYFTADEVVDAYEFCSSDLDKKAFNKKYAHGFKYFDDIMAEEMASNFGKRDIFRKMFEKRYANNAKTLISMNYFDEQDGIQKDIDKTLHAFGNRYGDRVFDRLFEMFNIIELKGESLRK